MEKTKLGISFNLFAALLFFFGAVDIGVVLIATGYVLLFEENIKLKATAVKALILTVFLTVLFSLVNSLSNLLTNIVSNIYPLFLIKEFDILTYSSSMMYLQRIIQFILQFTNIFMYCLKIAIPILCGFRAYKGKEIKIKWIDNILEKHFNKE